jgi:hypothetical protein
MPLTRRPGLDAVIKMATATAQKHADTSPNDLDTNSEMREAIASTWGLVKRRLGSGSPEAADLDGLIAKLVGEPIPLSPNI